MTHSPDRFLTATNGGRGFAFGNIVTRFRSKVHIGLQTVGEFQRTTLSIVDCAECGHPAAVLHGDVPMCGSCFYKKSVSRPETSGGSGVPQSDAMWRRLADAIAALETVAARVAAEMNELVRKRDHDSGKQ